ncbi:N-alpha-acetyltransferase 80 [Aedes albopictus]|uniref:N-acetyltransferase domain-containing protein n=1 Tax=Aedes albopictus TaxID=7160 RepID=A0ABM1ZXH7_AEDAL
MGKLSPSDSYTVAPIHQHVDLLDQCVQLINSEWPRSYTARLWSLKSSKDTLPTSMVLIDTAENEKSTVLAHAKLSPIPSDSEAVFIETVVVDRRYRGKGLGRFLMNEVEKHCFKTLRLRAIYLSTIDQEGFYAKLGYNFCKAMNMFGTRNAFNTSTKKIWMKKTQPEWNSNDTPSR